MTIAEILAVFAAGLGAGAINTLVGSGTLITFPTLVAFGYAPVTATISNAIGLVAGGVSGTWGYRRELSGQWEQLKWQMPASFCGALVGCWLGMYPIETAIVNACHSGQGGTGDVAILTAANRMSLMPFAQLATRIGGAITVTTVLVVPDGAAVKLRHSFTIE